jgi:hypothetical protein
MADDTRGGDQGGWNCHGDLSSSHCLPLLPIFICRNGIGRAQVARWPLRKSSKTRRRTRTFSIARAKRDGTRAETGFRLSPKRTSPFKSAGASVQSTAGSRGVRITLSNAGYTTFGGGVRVLATHSIRLFPFHFPSRVPPGSERALPLLTPLQTRSAEVCASSSLRLTQTATIPEMYV